MLWYPPSLVETLRGRADLPSGCREEVSIRAASIVAVERIRDEIVRICKEEGMNEDVVSCVLIDFYLWDLAKVVEDEGLTETVPIHCTRSIWY